MPINHGEILVVLQKLSEDRNLKVAVKESLKGACLVGSTAFAGSIIGGPVGLVIGSLIGSGLAYAKSNDKYMSVPYIITTQMTEAQRNELARSVYNIVRDIDATDATMLIGMLLRNPSLEALVLHELTGYFRNELGLSILG